MGLEIRGEAREFTLQSQAGDWEARGGARVLDEASGEGGTEELSGTSQDGGTRELDRTSREDGTNWLEGARRLDVSAKKEGLWAGRNIVNSQTGLAEKERVRGRYKAGNWLCCLQIDEPELGFWLRDDCIYFI